MLEAIIAGWLPYNCVRPCDRDRVFRIPVPSIVCKDGYRVSVQASETHYCEPRNNVGPYTSLELGFPNMFDELLTPYAEDSETYSTVYARVPVDVVRALISKHGGEC